MAVRSVYLPAPLIKDNRIGIGSDEQRHLVVARVQPGEVIEIFDGEGGVWTAAVEEIRKREIIVYVTDFRRVQRDPLQLILALALIRIPAFEVALEKVVEVGVTRVIPLIAERSNVAAGNRHDRWARIVIEAAKQSKQYYVPYLEPTASFHDVISRSAASKIIFAERDGGPLKSAVAGSPALYLVGPEGGWTDREVAAARDGGFHPVSLGAGILKTETAAIVGASLIRYELRR